MGLVSWGCWPRRCRKAVNMAVCLVSFRIGPCSSYTRVSHLVAEMLLNYWLPWQALVFMKNASLQRWLHALRHALRSTTRLHVTLCSVPCPLWVAFLNPQNGLSEALLQFELRHRRESERVAQHMVSAEVHPDAGPETERTTSGPAVVRLRTDQRTGLGRRSRKQRAVHQQIPE